jgi:hypothetical protein
VEDSGLASTILFSVIVFLDEVSLALSTVDGIEPPDIRQCPFSIPALAPSLVSVANRSLSFKIEGFSQFFLLHFLEMSVCLWTHIGHGAY